MRSKYKIVFLGNASVGKTTLISQFIYKQADDKYNPTIGIDFLSTKTEINNKEVRLQLWDTAGQERFNSIIPNYTRDSFISVIVFDLTNIESFNNLKHWIEDLVWINDLEKKCKLIIVGNKKDREDVIPDLIQKGSEFAKTVNGKYVSTNAMSYDGIDDMVKAMYEYIGEDILESGNVVDLGTEKEALRVDLSGTKKRCC